MRIRWAPIIAIGLEPLFILHMPVDCRNLTCLFSIWQYWCCKQFLVTLWSLCASKAQRERQNRRFWSSWRFYLSASQMAELSFANLIWSFWSGWRGSCLRLAWHNGSGPRSHPCFIRWYPRLLRPLRFHSWYRRRLIGIPLFIQLINGLFSSFSHFLHF